MGKKTTKLGIYEKKLFFIFVSQETVPRGGGMNDVFKFLRDDEHRRFILNRAKQNLDTAILAVRLAPDNPYGDDREEICKAILAKIDKQT